MRPKIGTRRAPSATAAPRSLLAAGDHELVHPQRRDRVGERHVEEGGGHELCRVGDELHPLRGVDVVGRLDRSRGAEHAGDLLLAPPRCSVHGAHGEPRALARGLPVRDARFEHVRGDLDDGADRALGAEHIGDVAMRHAVLQTDDEGVGGEVGADQLTRPAGVVGLDDDEDEIEGLPQGRDLAEVDRPNRSDLGGTRHPHLDAAFAHRLHVGRPLLDERDVVSGTDEVGPDSRALCSRAQHGDAWSSHGSSSCRSLAACAFALYRYVQSNTTKCARRPRAASGEGRMRTLIRNVAAATMDDEIGDLPRTDILVVDGVIARIAPDLPVEADEIIDGSSMIAMPGMVDTHRHTWQTALRGILADGNIPDYLRGIRLQMAPRYRADDMYVGNYAGALDALNSGITTLVDYCHNILDPDGARAAVEGLRDSGIRALYGHGLTPIVTNTWSQSRGGQEESADPVQLETRARLARGIRDEYFASDDQLLRFGIAPQELAIAPVSEVAAEFRLARELGARLTMHANQVMVRQLFRDVEVLHEHGLLADDLLLVHCTFNTDREWELLEGTGVTVSVCAETEMQMGMGYPRSTRSRAIRRARVSVSTASAVTGATCSRTPASCCRPRDGVRTSPSTGSGAPRRS